ncbi:[FeFe] hydrogenase H-cluster radical SAM maturase HydE [Roseburia amylophila]|uniref:[FeFe] hydrogenase H-cluster radical SAM maturase HydE n=1 Tax=Roseburia amylophila TaxID=2981794 RepID=A0ABT2SHA0_9FIRM|nr:[FeFe] hydrogenase H-cluster radical SAM maturase HydE [Roseburia amylophila]MCU6718230.1 [FeFe] hydrogenase H-cluster radical SAM maturase HydE [Roseburia amylophila]
MKNRGKELFNKLYQDTQLTETEYKELLELHTDKEIAEYGFELARKRQKETFGNEVYTRGLIEISNYCKNDCIYCGIRRSNQNAERYRLSEEEILSCCESGYALGFRTFVLQGGEDGYYTDDLLEDLLHKIKAAYPDCAITLSLGERSRESYERLYTAGADRYLLRHETANEAHYGKIHPAEMSLKNRKQCLYTLKEIGYQVGCGIMVGSPYQTIDNLVEDLAFMKTFNPHMVGIGPFIPQKDTPFGEMEPGSLEMTLFLLAIIRLMLPKVLLPATTALGTIHSRGRELGILAGGNVVMPNLSPVKVRKKYALYDNKICTGEEAAECRGCLGNRMESIGYKLVVSRGDSPFI